MRKSVLLILAVLHFAAALAVVFVLANPVQAADRCAYWDYFVGGERFDYTVDSNQQWNFPDDVQNPLTGEMGQPLSMTFHNGGIWEYYSPSAKAYFVIVFVDWDVTYPNDGFPGNHDLCVYKDKIG